MEKPKVEVDWSTGRVQVTRWEGKPWKETETTTILDVAGTARDTLKSLLQISGATAVLAKAFKALAPSGKMYEYEIDGLASLFGIISEWSDRLELDSRTSLDALDGLAAMEWGKDGRQ